MKAYKGFTKELQSKLGDGKKENCCFKIGETKEVKESKTVKSGFHCCENPFECLTYYALDGVNRFFIVEAEGDIDEDESERIACTKITLMEELTPQKFALEGLRYIIEHPQREKWQQEHGSVQVKENKCEAGKEGYIAIARGPEPMVKGPKGSILGMIVERNGEIQNAKLLVVPKKFENKWLRLTDKREVQIVEESED